LTTTDNRPNRQQHCNGPSSVIKAKAVSLNWERHWYGTSCSL